MIINSKIITVKIADIIVLTHFKKYIIGFIFKCIYF